MKFKVGDVLVGGDHTVVIAEAGVNHLRRLDYAEELIKTAARAGVDIVKFQTYDAEKLTTKTAPRFWEWKGEIVESGGQFDSYSRLATPDLEFTKELFALCRKYSVEFMSTPFDLDSAQMLHGLGCPAFKIASGDITNLPLLRQVGSFGRPIFLSTGASSVGEIVNAVNAIACVAPDLPICLMHCTLCYPTRAENANLSAVTELAKLFPSCVMGLSDHTIGPLIPAASILYGVKAIEKHYTFDNELPESADHWLSINEKGMSQLVRMLRQLEVAIGSGVKEVLACEEPARANARRSIVCKGGIKAGERFSSENTIMKRPGSGISPAYIDALTGLTAARDIADDELILPDDVVEDASFKRISPDLIKSGAMSHEF